MGGPHQTQEYCCEENSERVPSAIMITVKALTGRSWNMPVPEDGMRLLDIRAFCAEELNRDPRELKLVIAGKGGPRDLDERALPNDTVYVVFKMLSSCKPSIPSFVPTGIESELYVTFQCSPKARFFASRILVVAVLGGKFALLHPRKVCEPVADNGVFNACDFGSFELFKTDAKNAERSLISFARPTMIEILLLQMLQTPKEPLAWKCWNCDADADTEPPVLSATQSALTDVDEVVRRKVGGNFFALFISNSSISENRSMIACFGSVPESHGIV